MQDLIVPIVVASIVFTLVANLGKFIWKVIRIRVFGLKPARLDEEQLARTVAYCPKEYIRELKRLNPMYAHLDHDDERKLFDDIEKYTGFVVIHYLDSAKV